MPSYAFDSEGLALREEDSVERHLSNRPLWHDLLRSFTMDR